MQRAWGLSCYTVPVLLSSVLSLDHAALQSFWAHTHHLCCTAWWDGDCCTRWLAQWWGFTPHHLKGAESLVWFGRWF